MKTLTMRGKEIDMDALRNSAGATRAIGNADLNARGDVIDRAGNVIKSAEDITKAYYSTNPNAVTKSAPISLKDISDEMLMTPAQAIASIKDNSNKEDPKPRRKTRETED
jgi:hypothetical protein